MYQIMIKKTDYYRQYMVKEEIMKEVQVEVENELGEKEMQTELVGTGQYKMVPYSTEDKDELETTCVELLKKYNTEQVLPYENLTYALDLVWSK